MEVSGVEAVKEFNKQGVERHKKQDAELSAKIDTNLNSAKKEVSAFQSALKINEVA